MSYIDLRKFERILIAGFLLSIGILTTIDVLEDLEDGTQLRHLSLDIGIAVVSFLCVLILGHRLWQNSQRIKRLEKERSLLKDLADRQELKSKAFIEDLSVVVDTHFEDWGFSLTEREIGLFLLKGLSIDEIANIRSAAPKTVRNQTSAIYKKSNMNSRQEFQAFFFEDLLQPTEIDDKLTHEKLNTKKA